MNHSTAVFQFSTPAVASLFDRCRAPLVLACFSAAAPGRRKASSQSLPPVSNTGVSSSEASSLTPAVEAQKSVMARLSDDQATIIDTVSLVFPIRAVVADWEAVEVSVDRVTPARALKLPRQQQIDLASAWYRSDRPGCELIPPTDSLIEMWVNWLWRLDVSSAQASQQIDDRFDDIASALDLELGRFGIQLSPRNRGRNGFRHSADLVPSDWNFYRDGHPPALGHVAWGGIRNKHDVELAQLHLTGQGCEQLPAGSDWVALYDLMLSWGAHITRCDVAFDDFDGARGDVDAWQGRYDAGDFALRQQPSHQRISGDQGDTLYVGSRQSGKLLRAYCKGKQLGDAESPWVRLEVELHNKQRDIPLDILYAPDSYFQGAYPALSALDFKARSASIPTLVRAKAACTLKSLIYHAKRSYGKLVTVLEQIGMSAEEVLDKLREDGVPARLASVSFIHALDSAGRVRHPAAPLGDAA